MADELPDKHELERQLEQLVFEYKHAGSPVAELAALRRLRETVLGLIYLSVHDARGTEVPWSSVARALGISRQGAQRRYGSHLQDIEE